MDAPMWPEKQKAWYIQHTGCKWQQGLWVWLWNEVPYLLVRTENEQALCNRFYWIELWLRLVMVSVPGILGCVPVFILGIFGDLTRLVIHRSDYPLRSELVASLVGCSLVFVAFLLLYLGQIVLWIVLIGLIAVVLVVLACYGVIWLVAFSWAMCIGLLVGTTERLIK